MTQRDWQKDMDMMKGTFEFDWTNNQDLQIEMGEALPYWLQEAKERGEREQRLKEAMNQIIIEFDNPHNETGIKAACKMRRIAEEFMSTLYPDTPAPKEKGAPVNVD